ncbi:FIST signal transduction protein [Flavobacteriaceae bacterium M23B6Z8]
MYLDITNPKSLADAIAKHADGKAALICVAEHSEIQISYLITELNKRAIPFAGGIFPKVIYGRKTFDKGIVVSYFDTLVKDGIFMIRSLDSMDFDIPTMELKKDSSYCMLTFVDGLAPNISYYISELYKQFGNKTLYMGGGAGSLSLKQQPAVFNSEGVFQNAAVCMLLEKKSAAGVKHGWQKVAGPVIATKTTRNIINQLNWEPAFDIYRTALETSQNKTVSSANFFNEAKSYPFGILKEGTEYVVRDPISTDNSGALVCVGEVPENTMLDILVGDKDALIAAASEAAKTSVNALKNPEQAFVIDCISRVLFLEDEFEDELAAVAKELTKANMIKAINGVLTLGEIASQGNGYLEFYNKTIVVGLFE